MAALLIFTVYTAAQTSSPTLTTLYSFTGAGDAAVPFAGVVIGNGRVLYGTTLVGGAGSCTSGYFPPGCGTVFCLTPPTSGGGSWTEAVLHSFKWTDGATPTAGVTIGIDGVLYGTTNTGGTAGCSQAYGGCGTVFSLTPPTSPSGSWTEVVLHKFTGSPRDGGNPYAGIVMGSRGVLYGSTYDGIFGSNAKYDGTVFALIPPASVGGSWTESAVHHFTGGSDGLAPYGGVVIGPGGLLYGTTYNGGTGSCSGACGTVFSLKPPVSAGGTWTKTVLYNFTGGNDGGNPSGVVIGKGGVLYGTTDINATTSGGTIFSLTPPASPSGSWTETTLHIFAGSPSDGGSPNGVVIGEGGVLYGTTAYGGTGSCTTSFSFGCGTVFSLSPPASSGGSWTERVLYNFTGGSDGTSPVGGLAIGTGGILYGTTTGGGTSGFGTVFSLKP